MRLSRPTYQDANGIIRYKMPAAKQWPAGTPVVWQKYNSDTLCCDEIPATVVEYRGSNWVVIEAADGPHRVRPHNVKKAQ